MGRCTKFLYLEPLENTICGIQQKIITFKDLKVCFLISEEAFIRKTTVSQVPAQVTAR